MTLFAALRPALVAIATLTSWGAPANAEEFLTGSDTGIVFMAPDCVLQSYDISAPWFVQDQFDYLKGKVTVTMHCTDRNGRAFERKKNSGVWFLEPQFDARRRVWTQGELDLAHAFHALDVALAEGISATVWSDPTEQAIVFRIDLHKASITP